MAAICSIDYYVNMYEERIVNAPAKYAQNAIDIFQSRYQQTSLAYSDLLSTITSTMAFFHDESTVWNETRYVKTVFRKYVEDKSNMKRSGASMFTSDEFNEHVNILQRFSSEISTRSFDILSKLYVHVINYILDTCCEIVLRWMAQNTFDNQSTLPQVMA